MYIFLCILIVIACLLLIGAVLIQKSKGGGLASDYSQGNQYLGYRKTTDFIEKSHLEPRNLHLRDQHLRFVRNQGSHQRLKHGSGSRPHKRSRSGSNPDACARPDSGSSPCPDSRSKLNFS